MRRGRWAGRAARHAGASLPLQADMNDGLHALRAFAAMQI